MEVNGKMIEEGFDLFLTVPKIVPAPHLMKEHIALYPRTVASLGAYRIVSTPHRLPHLIEKHACLLPSHFSKIRQIIDKYWILSTGRFACLSPNIIISGKFA